MGSEKEAAGMAALPPHPMPMLRTGIKLSFLGRRRVGRIELSAEIPIRKPAAGHFIQR
jgi:hypothetical protein